MTRYKAIENEVRESYKEKEKNIRFYIHHGYMESWADEYKVESDGGIRRYSTDYRWDQYQNGKINREKAVEYAVVRTLKKLEKDLWTDLERLEAIENAKIPSFISIKTEWVRSRTWESNPHTEIYVQGDGSFEGRASGCGYDKESAAFASAAKGSFALKKILCEMKESALKEKKGRRVSGWSAVSVVLLDDAGPERGGGRVSSLAAAPPQCAAGRIYGPERMIRPWTFGRMSGSNGTAA